MAIVHWFKRVLFRGIFPETSNVSASGPYLRVHYGSGSPTAGDAATYGYACMYVDYTNNKLYFSNGTIWKYIDVDG